MASRISWEKKVSDSLNEARQSNILFLVSEENVRSLVEDYIFTSDVEGSGDEEVEEEEEGSLQLESEGASTSAAVYVAEDVSETEEQDFDLVEIASAPEAEIGVQNVGEEKNAELEKVKSFRCGCKLKLPDGRSGCIFQFEEEEILNRRMDICALTNDEKDFYIMGLLSAHGAAASAMTQHKRESRRVPRKLPRRQYTIEGKQVCREAFRFLLCLGQGRLQLLQKQPLETRRKSAGGRRFNTKALSAQDVTRVVKFIEAICEDHGLVLPGRIPGYHRADLKLLPSHMTKVNMWEMYTKAASDAGHRAVGKSSFKSLWKIYVPHIVVARPMTDLCNICQTNNLHILGGAGSTDQKKMELLKAQQQHLEKVQTERQFYKRIVNDSRETVRINKIKELGRHPPNSQVMSMGYCFDYAQQVHLPASPLQPGPMYIMTPRKCGLFGVCCPGIPQQINFVIDESMCCGKGSNSVISYLHFFFENYGLGETEAVLHCDNCSGQNKNNYMLWYLMWRVIHGYHTKISLNFMVPGHTKFAPDWCFGLLKKRFRRSEVHCLKDLCTVINSSATSLNRAQLVGLEDGISVMVPTYDWQTFLGPFFKPLKGMKSLFHFSFERGQPVIARSTDGEPSSYQLLKNVDLFPPAELPEPIVPPGISLERRKYLFDNIRQFVRDDCKDLLCPE